jgi:hypothetical protein
MSGLKMCQFHKNIFDMQLATLAAKKLWCHAASSIASMQNFQVFECL